MLQLSQRGRDETGPTSTRGSRKKPSGRWSGDCETPRPSRAGSKALPTTTNSGTIPVDRDEATRPSNGRVLLPRFRRQRRLPLILMSTDQPNPWAPLPLKRRIDELMDNVLFSSGCLESYRNRCAQGRSPEQAGKRLRSEIRRRGLESRGAFGSTRVEVPGRLYFDLDEEPTAETPVTVRELHFPRPPKWRTRKRGR